MQVNNRKNQYSNSNISKSTKAMDNSPSRLSKKNRNNSFEY